jgi:hypothetical protein
MISLRIFASTTCPRTSSSIVYAFAFPNFFFGLNKGLTTRQSMDYNVPGGKLNRGLGVVDSVTILKGRELTEEEYYKAAVLGWCVEWVCFFFCRAKMMRR